jgi:hypothetical protein
MKPSLEGMNQRSRRKAKKKALKTSHIFRKIVEAGEEQKKGRVVIQASQNQKAITSTRVVCQVKKKTVTVKIQ